MKILNLTDFLIKKTGHIVIDVFSIDIVTQMVNNEGFIIYLFWFLTIIVICIFCADCVYYCCLYKWGDIQYRPVDHLTLS